MSTIKTTNIQHPSAASPAIELTAAGGLWLGGGKILQVVRATDGTNRSTTSTSFVDASISVTITPQKSDSAILLVWSARVAPADNDRMLLQISDSSNNAVSGAEDANMGANAATVRLPVVIIGYSTPATTSATTYKGRFATRLSGNTSILNSTMTGQMYALEIGA